MSALQWHYRILQALALDEDLPEKPEDKTIPKYRQIDKVSILVESRTPFWLDSVANCPFQRAGDYVLSWAEELDSQYDKISAAGTPKTSTLVKRGAKDRDAEETAGGRGPAKRMKTEGNGLEDEIRLSFEKGAVSRVSAFFFQSIECIGRVLTVCVAITAYDAGAEKISHKPRPVRGRQKGRPGGTGGGTLGEEGIVIAFAIHW